MADAHNDRQTPERYEDTTNPRNPPNSVANSSVRKTALRSYLGPLLVFFIVAGLALIYWANRSPVMSNDPAQAEVGTSGQDVVGERGNDTDTPGGFEPGGRPGSTSDEIERRGGGERPQGPMPGLSTTTPLTELGAALEGDAGTVVGRRIEVHDVNVVQASDGRNFWVQDGNAKVAVTAPAGGPTVTNGATVTVAGVLESDGQGGVRIRASRVTD